MWTGRLVNPVGEGTRGSQSSRVTYHTRMLDSTSRRPKWRKGSRRRCVPGDGFALLLVMDSGVSPTSDSIGRQGLRGGKWHPCKKRRRHRAARACHTQREGHVDAQPEERPLREPARLGPGLALPASRTTGRHVSVA